MELHRENMVTSIILKSFDIMKYSLSLLFPATNPWKNISRSLEGKTNNNLVLETVNSSPNNEEDNFFPIRIRDI